MSSSSSSSSSAPPSLLQQHFQAIITRHILEMQGYSLVAGDANTLAMIATCYKRMQATKDVLAGIVGTSTPALPNYVLDQQDYQTSLRLDHPWLPVAREGITYQFEATMYDCSACNRDTDSFYRFDINRFGCVVSLHIACIACQRWYTLHDS